MAVASHSVLPPCHDVPRRPRAVAWRGSRPALTATKCAHVDPRRLPPAAPLQPATSSCWTSWRRPRSLARAAPTSAWVWRGQTTRTCRVSARSRKLGGGHIVGQVDLRVAATVALTARFVLARVASLLQTGRLASSRPRAPAASRASSCASPWLMFGGWSTGTRWGGSRCAPGSPFTYPPPPPHPRRRPRCARSLTINCGKDYPKVAPTLKFTSRVNMDCVDASGRVSSTHSSSGQQQRMEIGRRRNWRRPFNVAGQLIHPLVLRPYAAPLPPLHATTGGRRQGAVPGQLERLQEQHVRRAHRDQGAHLARVARAAAGRRHVLSARCVVTALLRL